MNIILFVHNLSNRKGKKCLSPVKKQRHVSTFNLLI